MPVAAKHSLAALRARSFCAGVRLSSEADEDLPRRLGALAGGASAAASLAAPAARGSGLGPAQLPLGRTPRLGLVAGRSSCGSVGSLALFPAAIAVAVTVVIAGAGASSAIAQTRTRVCVCVCVCVRIRVRVCVRVCVCVDAASLHSTVLPVRPPARDRRQTRAEANSKLLLPVKAARRPEFVVPVDIVVDGVRGPLSCRRAALIRPRLAPESASIVASGVAAASCPCLVVGCRLARSPAGWELARPSRDGEERVCAWNGCPRRHGLEFQLLHLDRVEPERGDGYFRVRLGEEAKAEGQRAERVGGGEHDDCLHELVDGEAGAAVAVVRGGCGDQVRGHLPRGVGKAPVEVAEGPERGRHRGGRHAVEPLRVAPERQELRSHAEEDCLGAVPGRGHHAQVRAPRRWEGAFGDHDDPEGVGQAGGEGGVRAERHDGREDLAEACEALLHERRQRRVEVQRGLHREG